MRILLTAATEAEIAPTLAWLRSHEDGDPILDRIGVCITGVGLMAATHMLTCALAGSSFTFVIGAGIAGAYAQNLSIADCVVVESEELADFGAEDGASFLDIFSMGLVEANKPPYTNKKLMNPLAGLPVSIAHLQRVTGLTVLTVSGHEPTIAARQAMYGTAVESMEGAALHYVCLQLGKSFVQLRAISNYVTRRDRSAWKIDGAIASLNAQLMDWLRQ